MWKRWSDTGSGPVVARAYHRILALAFLVAWLSLASQILRLAGSRGLLPATELLWFPASDALLVAGTWLGVLLALLAFTGVAPRVCFAISTVLYFGYAEACTDFLSFQWDNMLIELGFLAVFLPAEKRRYWIHLLLRLFLFKLYFESGIAKWKSPMHDWISGTAMEHYYETAPIPTALAYYAHHLPAGWHHVESWAVLFLELVVPFAILGPRVLKLVALFAFSAFQLFNIATANYTFFAYLSLGTHVFLLQDRDLERIAARLPDRVRRALAWLGKPKLHLPRRLRPEIDVSMDYTRLIRRAKLAGVAAVAGCYILFSTVEATAYFTVPRTHSFQSLWWLHDLYRPYRVFNRYHLFTGITTTRNEPEFQTYDGTEWTPHYLHYKPGPLDRRPPFVAPHQPRLDFLLWFYGIYYEYSPPEYVQTLVRRMCHDPEAVQGFFVDPLPAAPEAVKIVFYRYEFTTSDERAETGNWWKRTYLNQTVPIECAPLHWARRAGILR